MPDDLRWSCCSNNRNKAHHKCNVLESSRNHPPRGQWKNYAPRNWSLVPRLRPSFYSFNQIYWGVIYTLWKFIPFECTVLSFFFNKQVTSCSPTPQPQSRYTTGPSAIKHPQVTPALQPLATPYLISVPIVLPCPECHVNGLMQHVAFSDWFLTPSITHLWASYVSVVPSLLWLSSIPHSGAFALC